MSQLLFFREMFKAFFTTQCTLPTTTKPQGSPFKIVDTRGAYFHVRQ